MATRRTTPSDMEPTVATRAVSRRGAALKEGAREPLQRSAAAADMSNPPAPRRRSPSSVNPPASTPRKRRTPAAPVAPDESLSLMMQRAMPQFNVPLWIEVARLLLLIVVAGLMVLAVRPGPLHLVLSNAFGWAGYAVPVAIGAGGLELLRRHSGKRPLLGFEESCGGVLLFVAAESLLAFAGVDGGLVGRSLATELIRSIGHLGAYLIVVALLACGCVLAFHWSTAQILRVLWQAILSVGAATTWAGRAILSGGKALVSRRTAAPEALAAGSLPVAALSMTAVSPVAATGPGGAASRQARSSRQSTSSKAESLDGTTGLPQPHAPIENKVLPLRLLRGAARKHADAPNVLTEAVEAPNEAELVALAAKAGIDDSDDAADLAPPIAPAWPHPEIALLEAGSGMVGTPNDNESRKRIIEETLGSFNVKALVVGWHTGPTVTQFDLQPERGVRVGRITALQNDLALALAASSIRIEAPVPGRSVVGIQIPNSTTSIVTLRETLESPECQRVKSPLRIALGQNVAGETVVTDLARMPHLLIAGATGSGKSVCLNSLISCLLFHNDPTRLRLLMVDPKMVELTPFNGVPHLLAPVVTDVEKVPNTLKWALREMKDRYTKFTEVGARNIIRYNEMQTDEAARLPYIVIIIDELADLMMVAPEDVESSICRLAQLARATGIHLVIATQRPSVDVITGLIKANFPARIAFAVSSQVDSRTILDMAGAEKLMGRGDMLYMPSDGSKPLRVQGTWLSEPEIERLVDFWKYNAPQLPTPAQIAPSELEVAKKESEAEGDDKMVGEATKVVREYNRASVSLLQRRLSIGYSRAARILDMLEERGVVGPSEDGRSRIVLAHSTETSDDPATTAPVGEEADDDEPPF